MGRAQLRAELLQRCAAGGVQYRPTSVDAVADAAPGGERQAVTCRDGGQLSARLVAVASGAAAGRFVKPEEGSVLEVRGGRGRVDASPLLRPPLVFSFFLFFSGSP